MRSFSEARPEGILNRVAERRFVKPKREPFPWFVVLVFFGTVYYFWFSARQRHPAPIRIDYIQNVR
jgi:hypothetical protein